MKRLLTALTATVFLFSCTDEKKTDESAEKVEATKSAATVTYPYTANYSSDFSVGDPNHSKMVLDLYKMWEENRIDDMKALLADSVAIDFPDGNKFGDNTADSMMNMARQFRKQLSSIKINLDGWMAVRSNDKKEDFVLVWSRDYSTDLSGKTDSSRVHAYFLIKDNKIRLWSEYQQKLAPEPAKK